jgi:hypothetical protein
VYCPALAVGGDGVAQGANAFDFNLAHVALLMHTAGDRAAPTPEGVPVMITSPDASVRQRHKIQPLG